MEKHFLSKTGLSITQAQSISNLCNQYCVEIDNVLQNINIISKEFTFNQEHFIEQKANEIDKKKIQLKEPIKVLGTHTVNIKLHKDVTAQLNVIVKDV